MSQSPVEPDSSDGLDAYLEGWNELAAMLRRGGSLSGREPNCCYLNLRGDGVDRFADVSAASGFDYLDDGRALALIDWDFDGDLDLWGTNRTSPRVRVVRNNADANHRFVALRLEGTTSNHDAVGARVELVVNADDRRRLIRTVRAGDSYLTQSTRWLHFGLGDAESVRSVRVFWPGATAFEEFSGVQLDGRYLIVQGAGTAKAIDAASVAIPDSTEPRSTDPVEPLPERVLVVGRWPFPPLTVRTPGGASEPLLTEQGRPLLINFWASWCAPCLEELAEWTTRQDEINAAGLNVVALSARNPDQIASDQSAEAQAVMERLQFPFRWRLIDESGVSMADAVMTAVNSDYERPFGVPTSILLDRYGQVAAVYRGAVDLDVVLHDAALLDATPEEVRKAATPLGGVWVRNPPRGNPNSFASQLELNGQIEEAERYWRHILALAEIEGEGPYAISDRWKGAAAFALGSSLLRDSRIGESAAFSQQAIELRPNDYRPRANLGSAFLQLGDADRAIEQFDAALELSPGRASVLTNRATAYRQLDRLDRAIADWEAVLEETPDDEVARKRVAAASLAVGDEGRAVRHYQYLLQESPDSMDLIGTLAWILATSPDETVRDGATAIEYASQWVEATNRRDPKALNALAAAQAETGDFTGAVKTMNVAVQLGRQQNDEAMLRVFAPRLELYQQGKPFHRPPPQAPRPQ